VTYDELLIMVERHPVPFGLTRLRGRRTECSVLDAMIAAVREGQGRSLVVVGEAGIGKTTLLEYAVESASGLRVLRAVGVESEMELAFAALHQLCAPLLDRVGRLPAPQREALEIVFGVSGGPAPDLFLVGLAVLTLLSDAVEERPLLCVVDDAQWLDQASARTLAFVARRLLAEPVALLFAAREPDMELKGLPVLEVRGLCNGDARALLGSVVQFVSDERVRDRIVAETRGNPLALLELPRGLTATELAGGFALPPRAPTLAGRIEQSFLRRLEALPEETRRLLLVAAAEPTGDPLLMWRAAERLGIEPPAAAAAETDGLLAVGDRVTFRHPLVRSAVYRSASSQERQAVHLALAEVTDRQLDPDRRAWHRATAARRPDEEIASALERSADRAQARGGLAAAAAFLQRSVALTEEPPRRAERALAAAQVSMRAGAFDAAEGLLATAETGALDALRRAQVYRLRGQIASASGALSEAPAQLLRAAKRLEPLDAGLARETYLDAMGAAVFAGCLASAGNLREVARAARSAPQPPRPPCPSDLLLDGLALLITEGRAAAAPTLRRAVSALRGEEIAVCKGLRLVSMTAATLWDFESWEAVLRRQVELARDAGALAMSPIVLHGLALPVAARGDFADAASLVAEADAVAEATGTRIARFGALPLAGFRGREAEASAVIEATIEEATDRGEGLAVQMAHAATAVLYNGLGRYQEALPPAKQASEEAPQLFISGWALLELIEASVRSRNLGLAAAALERLAEATEASDSDWGLGMLARSRALLSQGRAAEGLYREAIDRLSRTPLRPALARAHLLYGEWLRRENRRVDARTQLRTAHDMFVTIGMEAFAERARIELLATGEKVRLRTVETRDELTAQERQIATLARDGLSNPEIGARLFISPRTVEWHLGKVFTKLGISSRMGLQGALRTRHGEAAAA
jgi:DNA-binding CsgD family transcriptional regulator